MAIHAQSSCTLSTITDVEAVYTYYYLSSSSITVDEAPKDNINPPGASTITVVSDGENYVWQMTEPELNIIDDVIQTAVGKLYVIECVQFSDGTYDWGPLMTSSTYAAAKAAYNLSSQALTQATAANNATALLGGHFIYNSTWSTTNTPHSANVVQTVTKNGIDVTQDPTKWDYNVHIGANGIRLRNNEVVLSEWSSTALKFYNPQAAAGQNSLQLSIGANGTLQSGNYTRGSDSKFAQNGTKIDLINGDIITKYFRLSQGLENLNAGAYIHGTIEALDGSIGSDSTNYWEIGNYTDYNLHDSAKIIGHGSAFVQLGDDNTWRLSTNRIHSGWYTSADTVLHYPVIDSKYWDYGIHTPSSSTDKFLYIRTSKDETSTTNVLTNLLYDIDDDYATPQWDYKFWVDAEGKVHAQGFYVGDSTTPIGGGAGTVAEKLLTGAGSSSRPVYFRSDSGHVGEVAQIDYTIESNVPQNAIFTDHITSASTSGNGNAVTAITSDSSGNLSVVKGTTFLTSETDPTVPEWAKQSSKPSYSYSEITGTVPTSALPSYVDDVLEYSTQSAFPTTGESGKIYISADNNKTYRWSGSAYVEISSSLALGETSSTAYRGDRGKTAYDHAYAKGSAFTSGLYKITTNAEGHVTAATAAGKGDIGLGNVDNKSSATIRSEITSSNVTTALGFTPYNSTNPDGFITSADVSDTHVNMQARGTTKAYLLGTTTTPTASNQAVESVAETGVYFDTTTATLVATTFKGALTGTASGNLTSNSNLAWAKVTGADDLKAIENLSGTSGFLKKTAANTWTLDTNTYLTSYTETDPVFSASAAANISDTDITNWNGKTSNTGTVTSVKVQGSNGLTGSGTITTSGTITISHADTSSQTSSSNSGRTYIQSVTLDDYGHVTALTTATETITNTHNTAYLYAGASNGSANAQTSNGNTYLILVDGGTATTRRKISGSGTVSVASDSSGNITITGSAHPTALKNPNAITLNLFNETAARTAANQNTPTSTVTYDGDTAELSFSAAGRNAVTNVSSNNEGKLILTRADGSQSDPITVKITATTSDSAASADKLNISVDAGSLSTPVYFPANTGLPAAVTSIAYSLLPTGTSANTVAIGNHSHGNLTTDGKITSTATIASGDKLVIVDSDSTANSKITGSSITFGTSTTTFLTNKGTWATPVGTTYTAGTGLSLSNGEFSVKLGYTTSGNNRKVQADTDGNLYVVQKDNNTTYTFVNGTNGFTVTPSGGTAQTVTVTPSITDNITGSGTSGYLVKFDGTNTITDGPQLGSATTTFLRNDGTWATPSGTYSLSIAKYDTLGGVKPWYSTTGTSSGPTAATYSSNVTVNARSSDSGRYYAVEIDKNGRLFVNVPWVNSTDLSGAVTSITTTEGAHSTISNVQGSVSFNVPTKTSHLTNDSGYITSFTDENVKSTAVTAATTNYIVGSTTSTTTTGGLSKHASAVLYTTANSATSGYTQLRLGNTTATSSAGGKEGQIRLYGTNATYYVDLKPGAIASSNKTITFPNASGTVALTSDLTNFITDAGVISITTTAGTHTAITNATGAVSFNVPTKTSHLTNDSNFVTSSGVTSITLTQGTGITVSSSGTAITSTGTRTISLATITKSDSTSTASPAHGGTFTAVDSITYDTYGRVTGVNTKTITLPSDSNTDTLMTQAYSTTNNTYPLLMTATAGISSTSSRGATTGILNNGIYGNPSNGLVNALIYQMSAKAQMKYDSALDAITFVFI